MNDHDYKISCNSKKYIYTKQIGHLLQDLSTKVFSEEIYKRVQVNLLFDSN